MVLTRAHQEQLNELTEPKKRSNTEQTLNETAKNEEETTMPTKRQRTAHDNQPVASTESDKPASEKPAIKRKYHPRGRLRFTKKLSETAKPRHYRPRRKTQETATSNQETTEQHQGGSEHGGDGEATQTSEIHKDIPAHNPEEQRSILEMGKILLFYRPRVEHDKVDSEADVQRILIELKPTDSKRSTKFRLLTLGRKQLPDPDESGRKQVFWGFVDMVSDFQEEIDKQLQSYTYNTKTLGERVVGAARCAGEGEYEIVMHNGRAQLAYVLTSPHKLGEVQESLHIKKEASMIIQIKNPNHPDDQSDTFHGLSEKQRPTYSEELLANFDSTAHKDHQTKYVSTPNVPAFLDVMHTELLLIASATDIQSSLKDAVETLEQRAEEDEAKGTNSVAQTWQ